MADVMEQCGDPYRRPVVGGDIIAIAKFCKDSGCKMKGSEAVREARMLCSLIGKMPEAKLPDTSEALEFGRIYEPDDQPALGGIHSDTDYIVDRITVDPF